MTTPKALKTATLHVDDHVRKQNWRSPPWVLRPCYRVLGDPIGIEPYGHPESLVRALDTIMPPADAVRCEWGPAKTFFVNPSFDDLERAISRCARAHFDEGLDGIGLWPFRSHRNYWDPVWTAHALAFLPPVAFISDDGKEDDSAPFPCVAVLWGPGRVDRFVTEFERVGADVLRLRLTESGLLVMLREERQIVMPGTDSTVKTSLKASRDEALREHQEAALLQVIRAHAHLSLSQIAEAFTDEPETMEALQHLAKNTPLAELVGLNPRVAEEEAPAEGGNGAVEIPTDLEGLDAQVYEFIAGTRAGMTAKELLDATEDSTKAKNRRSLERLQTAGYIVKDGKTRGATYTVGSDDDHYS